MPSAHAREILVKAGQYPYSPVVAFGDQVFISGAVGHDPDSGEMPADIGEQTVNTLRKIQGLLAQANTSLDRALKITIFLTDMSEFAAMNSAYREFFAAGFPARSCVQIAALPDPLARVEIEVIAAR